MQPVPLVTCSGAPRARGQTYGEQAKDLILANVETYREHFAHRFGLSWDRARRQVEDAVPYIRGFDPDLLDELHGVAEGAGADFGDVLVLNARSSITMTRAADECTTIAHVPEIGSAGATIIGQNWDNMGRLRPVVLRVDEPGRPSILTFTEAGTLAKIGMNSAGIGLCVNGLCVAAPGGQGVPIFVMLRKVLQMTSVAGAMGVITTAHRDAPHNYMLATKEGAAFTVEALVGDFDILPPPGRFLVHTNHILSQRLTVRDELKTSHPDTVVRLWRAQRLLARHEGEIGAMDLLGILADHFDAPHAICRHPNADADPFAMQTNNSIVMDLTAGRMHVTRGRPCATDADAFEF